MFNLIKNLFKGSSNENLADVLKGGALVVDVRSPGEYKSGHAKGAVNIPLDSIAQQLSKLKKEQAIVLCCRSGARSGRATSILKSRGFNAINGGTWQNVDKHLR